MNTDPSIYRANPERHDIFQAELQQQFGEAADTKGRFNLIRAELALQGVYAHDVILSDAQRTRLLAVDSAYVDKDMYDRIQHAGIPQLPLLRQTEHLTAFSVPRGAKLLSNEPTFNRHSSATYISDRESFTLAGRIYGAAWLMSGKLPLSGPGDTPLNHLALTNFTDEQGYYMYLCPPYGDSATGLNAIQACQLFTHCLQNSRNRTNPTLEDAAVIGFNEMVTSQGAA